MKYKLTQDNDCHWYVIPSDRENEFENWLELDPDDEASWTPPDFAMGVDGPHTVTFDNYEES